MNILDELFALFYQFDTLPVVAGVIVLILALGYSGAPLWLWSVLVAGALWGFGVADPIWLYYIFGVLFVFSLIKPIRAILISKLVMITLEILKFLPTISETERVAIDAGTVWVDKDLFSGSPNFKKLMKETYPQLTPSEKSFLEKQTATVCAMVNDWDVHQERGFSKNVWDYLKQEKFFGMIIPEEYGGLGFSAEGHSAIISSLSTRSSALAITVMVPNSLGPAELLIHYGTQEQKDHYLPRLADGRDIPCFGLTEANAGSDAGAMTAHGEVYKDKKGDLRIKLNWSKRYITLGAIATVIGLAFKLYDPQNLLGKGTDLGITCALIPSDTKGVELGRRHDPLGIPFYNCPIDGKNVDISVDNIIGGAEQAGNGWRMLMESLAAGRGISLPATSAGGAKFTAKVVSAYSAIREQFGLTIGKFEGVSHVLGQVGGFAYLLDAARAYTTGGIDSGNTPAVVTAIMKYHSTELLRKSVNHAMDILGGAAISRGPKNLMAHPYNGLPIGITVEGANILTRTLIIFGQGAIRCHPYALEEVLALESKDVFRFDRAFWSHINHVVKNGFRSVLLYITRGHLSVLFYGGPFRNYVRKLNWISAQFALYADIALMTQGGNLKRKEILTGRLGDILSWMYLCTAVLKRFDHDGRRKEDRPFVHFAMQYGLNEIQNAFQDVLDNFGPVAKVGAFFTRINPFSAAPQDKWITKIAHIMQVPGSQRDRITEGVIVPTTLKNDPMADLERTFKLVHSTAPLQRKVKEAIRKKTIRKNSWPEMIADSLEHNVLTQDEAELLKKAEAARFDAITVDFFDLEEYKNIKA